MKKSEKCVKAEYNDLARKQKSGMSDEQKNNCSLNFILAELLN